MATKALLENKVCGMSPFKIGLSIFFYVSYAILFANFFYWTYVHKRPGSKVAERSKVTETLNGTKCSQINEMSSEVSAKVNGVVSNEHHGLPIRNGTHKAGLSSETQYNLRSRRTWQSPWWYTFPWQCMCGHHDDMQFLGHSVCGFHNNVCRVYNCKMCFDWLTGVSCLASLPVCDIVTWLYFWWWKVLAKFHTTDYLCERQGYAFLLQSRF